MSKKLISVMLALVMVLSVFSISAFAVNVEFEGLDAEHYQMWYLETTNEPDANGDYTVDVYLEADYYVGAISFHVDAVGATLKDADASEFVYDADGYYPEVEFNEEKGNVYIVPKPIDATKYGLDVTTATHIATLTYTLTADSATITLVNDAKTIDNDGKLIAARLGDDVLSSNTMYYGQWVNDIDYNEPELGAPISEVTLGEEVAADPELIAVEGSTGYVDNDRMYVYGVPAGTVATDFGDYFEATNDGYFEMSVGTATVENGTGAILTLYNEAGDEITTYTLVIFGDVDGSGEIKLGDASAVYSNIAQLASLTDAQVFAADIDKSGDIKLADASAIYSHIAQLAFIDSNIWA